MNLILLIIIYLLPCFIAHSRNHNNLLAICALTILTSWTILGWIAGIIWACSSNVKTFNKLTGELE